MNEIGPTPEIAMTEKEVSYDIHYFVMFCLYLDGWFAEITLAVLPCPIIISILGPVV